MKLFTDYIDTKKIFPDGMPEKLVMHSDGVGSKASLLLQHMDEDDEDDVYGVMISIAREALAMNINDMTIIGCTGTWMYNNTIHLNPKWKHLETPLREAFVYFDRHYSIVCVGGETCITDKVSDIMVDVTMLVGLKKPKWDLENVWRGQIVYGWKTISAGSNGFTLIRKYFDKLSKESQEQVLRSTPFFWTTDHNLSDIDGLVHCTGDGLFKSERWGIEIDFDWENIYWPYWVVELSIVSGINIQELMRTINGGYQMLAFGSPGLLIGSDWVELGTVK